MMWTCRICGYHYNPDEGDIDGEIPPGTSFEELPDEWLCPICGASKEFFSLLEE
ncbi:MAG: rubredoxin [Candidatus Hodarchaeota archaeon]